MKTSGSKGQHLRHGISTTNIIIAVVIIIVVALAAVAYSFGYFGGTTTTKKTPLKICAISSSAPTDLSWTATAYNALAYVQTKYNATTSLTQFVATPDAAADLRNYAASGCTIVLAHGAQYEQAVDQVAGSYPNTWFIANAGSNSTPPKNVVSVSFARYQGAYLLGYLAASLTKTGIVANIGGANYPIVIRDHNGFVEGAKAANPHVKVLTSYVGSWTDPVTAKTIAQSLIQQGADVIWTQADLSNVGVLGACEASHILVMYTDSDPYPVDQDVLVTSVLMGVPQVLSTVVTEINNGTMHGGYLWQPGMAGGYVSLSPYHDLNTSIPLPLQTKITQMTQQIISGQLVVPLNYTMQS